MSSEYEDASPLAVFEKQETCPEELRGCLVEVERFDGIVRPVKYATGGVVATWENGSLSVQSNVQLQESWPWYADMNPDDRKFENSASPERVVLSSWMRGTEDFVRSKIAEREEEYRSVAEEAWKRLQQAAIDLAEKRRLDQDERDRRDAEYVSRMKEMAQCHACRSNNVATSAGIEPCEKHRERGYPMRPISVFMERR